MSKKTKSKELLPLYDDKGIDKLVAIFDPQATGRQFTQGETRALMCILRDIYEADRWSKARK